MLCEFDELCKVEGYAYSLAGGTLLGAIRHKDLIPWDDDIDLFMLRDDYERFLEKYAGKFLEYTIFLPVFSRYFIRYAIELPRL